MKQKILPFLLILLILAGCDTNAGTTSFSVHETAAEITEVTRETVRMNNCGGRSDVKQIVERSKSVIVEVTGLIGVDKMLLSSEVSAKYSQIKEDVKKMELTAPAQTNMEFILEWTEKTWVGIVTTQGRDGAEYKVSVPISVELISSEDLGGCSSQESSAATSPQPVAPPSETPRPADTPVPMPTATLVQDTPAGTLLQPGQTWIHNGKALTLQRYEFFNYPGIQAYWRLENLGVNPVSILMSEDDFNARNNLGQSAGYKRFYRTSPGQSLVIQPGDYRDFSIDLWLEFAATSITEIIITVSISDFPNAQWMLEISH